MPLCYLICLAFTIHNYYICVRYFSSQSLLRIIPHDELILFRPQVSLFVTSIYNSFIIYSIAINETLNAGEDPREARNILKRLRGRMFEGECEWIIV